VLLINPKTEPSTGMDPRSRRFMWETIRANAVGRACLLTTHNMVEADTLCTRIGIVANGKLQAIGSSSHLKQTFGHGYRLEVKVAIPEQEGFEKFMQRNFSGHEKLDSHDENLVYRIPTPAKLGGAFNLLLQAKQDGTVKDFTLGQVTLEQVFSMIVESKFVDADNNK
jgi:ATP-binding cassette subfamily A (ABC1) protein 5